MNQERVLKILLVFLGLLFTAVIIPLVTSSSLWHATQSEDVEAMMLSLYVTLGIFLLIAARNPSANRSLIAFTAWSSIAHAAVMVLQSIHNPAARGQLLGASGFLVVIGVALIAFSPAKGSFDRTPAANV